MGHYVDEIKEDSLVFNDGIEEFKKLSIDDKGNSVWSLSLQEKTYIDKNKHIQVN